MRGQKRRKTLGTIGAGLLLALAVGLPVRADDDPSIKGELRQNIQTSMRNYIRSETLDGTFFLYDPVEEKLLRLRLDHLHDGIVRKGDFFVSCADFVDQNGRKLDLDMLVLGSHSKLITTQAIIHAVDGSKRQYHLEGN
jgi:hypothetical protein